MFVTEEYRSRVLLAPQATDAGGSGYLAPTPGTQFITLRAIAGMGNAADLALSLKYADDTNGTNTADFADVRIFKNGVRQTDGHIYTVSDDTGNVIVDFCILPGQIPAGKTIGIAYGASNAANLVSAEMIEDTTYEPTEA